MSTRLFTIDGKINIENQDANKKLETTGETAKSTGSKIAEYIGKGTKAFLSIGTAVATAAGVVVAGAVSMAKETAKTTDTIDKASQRMNISKKSYQELSYAAGQCGISMSQMEQAAKKLEGTDINMDDAINQIMTLGTEQERTKKATELFGEKVAYNLSPLLKQSGEEFKGLTDRANELGLVLSDKAIESGVEFGDLLSDFQQSLKSLKNNLASSFMPILNKLLDMLLKNMPTIQKLMDSLAPVITNILEIIVPPVAELVNLLLPVILQIITTLMPILQTLFEQIMPPFVEILNLLLPPLLEIVQAVLPILTPLLELITPLLTPIMTILSAVVPILEPIISVIRTVVSVLSTVLKPVIELLTTIVNKFMTVWKSVFDKLYSVMKTPINLVIDGINKLISGLNKIKLPDWEILGGAAGKGINIPLLKKLKVGMEYIPYDEMPALLHKGEAVLNKEDAEEYRKGKNGIVNNTQAITNNFNISKIEVKDDKDIERIAQELYYLQRKAVV